MWCTMGAQAIRRSGEAAQGRNWHLFAKKKSAFRSPSLADVATLFFPVEHAFPKRVNISNHQDRDETEHAPKDDGAMSDGFPVNDRPGVHENDFQIEKNEQHRDQIEFDAESRLYLSLWHHAAFVG